MDRPRCGASTEQRNGHSLVASGQDDDHRPKKPDVVIAAQAAAERRARGQQAITVFARDDCSEVGLLRCKMAVTGPGGARSVAVNGTRQPLGDPTSCPHHTFE
jgi:hypothetical protein